MRIAVRVMTGVLRLIEWRFEDVQQGISEHEDW